jgi:hypothetical protein
VRALSWLLGFALALAPARVAASSIAREPIVRILRQAAPAVRGCAARFALPDGRYAVRLAIYDGRVLEVRVIDSPVPLAPEAEVCLSGAHRRLRFPEMTALDDGRPEHWSIAFPFVLSLEPRLPPAPRVRPRPARVGAPGGRRNFGPLPG